MGKNAWFAIGIDSYGKRAVAGPFASDEEARAAKDAIPQITDIKELPTTSLAKAKAILKYQQAYGSGDLSDGLQRMRGYDL